MLLNLETPAVFRPLLGRSRYKGAYGGRGSGKSYFFADLAIERCLLRKTDIVCIREIQKSLEQSAKKLIEGQIYKYGLSDKFVIRDKAILTPGGGRIIFQGMQNHTADSIKSLEGFDIAWVEEADTLGQRSLDLLRPTIRKDGGDGEDSEIWFSWNPKKPYDPVDKFLRGHERPDNAIVVEVNYYNNPFFPEVLKTEMEADRKNNYEKYLHTWCGQYLQAGSMALIQLGEVQAAVGRKLGASAYRHAPRILGVDCARYGDDETVICFRQGLNVHWFRAFSQLNEMAISRKVAAAIEQVNPQAVFMDTTGGYGAGAYDRLIELGFKKIFPVVFSSKSDVNEKLYQNKRIEIWDAMREWFGRGCSIPHDPTFEAGVVAPECIYNKSTGRKQLESKEEVKARIGMSPDKPDALALTFAFPVHGAEEVRPKTEAEKDWLKVTGFGMDNDSACNIMG